MENHFSKILQTTDLLQHLFDAFCEKNSFSQKVFCITEQGNEVPFLRFGNGEKYIIATARHHACESSGSYVLEGVLDEFDRVIGLEYLKALHINDSKNPCEAHKDRHACIGEGYIGKEAIARILSHPKLQGLPCVLETPQESLEGYGEEIEMIRGML